MLNFPRGYGIRGSALTRKPMSPGPCFHHLEKRNKYKCVCMTTAGSWLPWESQWESAVTWDRYHKKRWRVINKILGHKGIPRYHHSRQIRNPTPFFAVWFLTAFKLHTFFPLCSTSGQLTLNKQKKKKQSLGVLSFGPGWQEFPTVCIHPHPLTIIKALSQSPFLALSSHLPTNWAVFLVVRQPWLHNKSL